MSAAAVQTAADHAAHAGAAIRSFNHATLFDRDLHTVPDVYAITAELANMGYRLRQACEQLAGILESRLMRGHLAADDGTDPAVAISAARAELRFAAAAATELGDSLNSTQNWVATISDDAP